MIDLTVDAKGNPLNRDELKKVIEKLQAENEKLISRVHQLSSGLVIRGWWCICDIFNGEEKELRTECKSCGKAKTTRDYKGE